MLVVIAATAAGAPSAWAAGGSVPNNPSFDQYVPSLPASSGKTAPGAARNASPSGAGSVAPKTSASPPPLPEEVRRKLFLAGATGERLNRLSTSPELGAPAVRLRAERIGSPGAASAAVHAVGRAGGAAGWVLVGCLVLITAGLLVASPAWRGRGHRDGGDS